MDSATIHVLADELFTALVDRRPVEPLTARHPDLSVDVAYAIQQTLIARRLAAGDDAVVGRKIGVTSKAVMKLLGVDQPDFGLLLRGMQYADGAAIPVDRLIQPRIEAEIAFRLRHDLAGPGVTPADVLAATDAVLPCFEVVDSRIRDWRIRIQDTVADNASCGVFVLGDAAIDPARVDLLGCRMTMQRNDAVVATGTGAATLGSPLTAVAWLANAMGRLGVTLRAGEIVLSGALGAMVPVVAGDRFGMHIDGLGGCTCSFI